MRPWVWWVLGGAALAALGAGAVALDASMLASAAAARLGLSNEPATPEDRARLAWLQARRDHILSVLRRTWPSVTHTSAYRSPAVNAAVGGSSTSRHMLALALDFGGLAGIDAYESAGRAVLAEHRAGRLPLVRDIIAETTPLHLHVDFHDPLGIIDTAPRAARLMTERGQAENRFTVLA